MKPPVVQIVGRKKSGKTTLISRLLAELVARGYRIGTVKHTSHNHQFDSPGTDSWSHRQAGSETTVILSPDEFVCHSRMPGRSKREEIMNLLFSDKDLVVWEGHDGSNAAKIECLTPGQPSLFSRSEGLIAVVTEEQPFPEVENFRPGETSRLARWLEVFLLLRSPEDIQGHQ